MSLTTSPDPLCISPGPSLNGRLKVPGDKSISHRLLMLGALAEGNSQFTGLGDGADVRSTAACLRELGVEIELSPELTTVKGVGLHGLQAPQHSLDCGNSGTTLRLLMGILAGQAFASTLIGDASLSARPMGRVAAPLQQMGAQIQLTQARFAPVEIQPAPLQGINYHLPVASAQVKSALLWAGLYAQGPVTLSGELASRDHSERLLPAFGVQLQPSPEGLSLMPGQRLQATELTVPGDPSSAAFWLAAAALVPGSEVTVEQISLNPTRIGFFEVLKAMGAEISWQLSEAEPEPWGSVSLRHAPLKAFSLSAADIPYLVDEVPLLALLATQAEGRSEVRGAEELRVKESDRLAVMAANLRSLGAVLEEFEDGFAITGPQLLTGGAWQAHHDHRIAMTGVLAGLVASGETQIEGADSMAVSYPSFLKDLEQLQFQGCPPA